MILDPKRATRAVLAGSATCHVSEHMTPKLVCAELDIILLWALISGLVPWADCSRTTDSPDDQAAECYL